MDDPRIMNTTAILFMPTRSRAQWFMLRRRANAISDRYTSAHIGITSPNVRPWFANVLEVSALTRKNVVLLDCSYICTTVKPCACVEMYGAQPRWLLGLTQFGACARPPSNYDRRR